MKTALVIPIKTNNQRLPGKNTKLLAGTPLYDYLFQTVKKCTAVDDVYVDSSDSRILQIAKKNNFLTIARPKSLNSAATSGNDLLNFELSTINHDIICQAFVTLPFLTSKSIDRAINTLKEDVAVDCVLPLYRVYDRFWSYKDKRLEPVNHDSNSLLGTQYMTPIYRESGFYVFRRATFLRENRRVAENFKEIYVPFEECIDIDTHMDFLYAESVALWNQKNEN